VIRDTQFMGAFVAAAIVGFAAIVVVLVLVTVVLSWTITWQILWSRRMFILVALIIPTIISTIQKKIGQQCLFAKDAVKHRAAASIYMFWDVWLSILAGTSTAIARFVVGLVSIVLAQPQVVTPATAPLLNNLAMLDAQHASYVGAIHMFHYHNHPVVVCAVHRLLELGASKKHQLEKGLGRAQHEQSARRRSRRIVLLLLMKHPFLKQYRKAAIAAKLAEEEAAGKKVSLRLEQQQRQQRQMMPDSERLIRNEIEELEAKVLKLRGSLPVLQSLQEGSKEEHDLVRSLLASSGSALSASSAALLSERPTGGDPIECDYNPLAVCNLPCNIPKGCTENDFWYVCK